MPRAGAHRAAACASASFFCALRPAADALLTPMAEAELLLPCRDRRLHRLLRFHPPRHQRRQHVPPGQSAAAELQVAAGGISRARLVDLVASGTAVRRPCGQIAGNPGGPPVYAATRRLDYELEVGRISGTRQCAGGDHPRRPGAQDHIAGVCLLNDWSARDIQSLGISAARAVSGQEFRHLDFAVGRDPGSAGAVSPRRRSRARPPIPQPLPHLAGGTGCSLRHHTGSLASFRPDGRAGAHQPRQLSASMYWTLAQMVAHHASNGCNLRPGDLIGSGTVSRPGKVEPAAACWNSPGAAPSRSSCRAAETRRFLEDGDEVILRGWCEAPGFRRIGLGECRGRVLPPSPDSGNR